MKGRVLIIAGSDPSGGAGIQADVKTVTMLGGYAMAAITALTVQNTRGVKAVEPVAPAIIRDQIVACLEDIGADAIKIGMIGSAAAAGAILEGLAVAGWSPEGGAPLVLDPVLAATSGDKLAADDLAGFIRLRMLKSAYVVTPNIPEAEALTGLTIRNAEAQREAGAELLKLGAAAALVKGGHIAGEDVYDVLVTGAEERTFRNPRLGVREMHGTGCTLASAIAAGLAQALPLAAAVKLAIDYVHEAIRAAPEIGTGAAPLNHSFLLEKKRAD